MSGYQAKRGHRACQVCRYMFRLPPSSASSAQQQTVCYVFYTLCQLTRRSHQGIYFQTMTTRYKILFYKLQYTGLNFELTTKQGSELFQSSLESPLTSECTETRTHLALRSILCEEHFQVFVPSCGSQSCNNSSRLNSSLTRVTVLVTRLVS